MKKLSAVDKAYLFLRLVLIVAIWLVVALKTPLPDIPFPCLSYVLPMLIVFTIYSLIFTTGLFFFPKHHRLLYLSVLPLDLLSISFAVRCTGTSSLFYLGYIAIISVYSLCFKLEVGLSTAAASALLLLLIGKTRLVSVNFLLQVGFLFTLAFILCSIAEKERKEKQEIERLNQVLYDSNAELNRKALELNAISEIAMSIHSTLELNKLATLVLNLLRHVLDLDMCTLVMMDKKTKDFVFLATEKMSQEEVRKVFLDELKRENWLNPLETKKKKIEPEQLSFFKCLPLLNKEDAIVALCASAKKIDEISQDDMVVLSAIASELAIALENARLYELTRKLSVTDELTELFNYRYFYDELRLEIERAERYARPLSVVMIDVDDFKRYNDSYGHIQGDRALTELAGILKQTCREFDVLARYGGEEFAIILPETNPDGAYATAEKIRQAVGSNKFEGSERKRDANLTISVGFASYPVHAVLLEDLVKEADGALYEAKNSGRNRVCVPRAD